MDVERTRWRRLRDEVLSRDGRRCRYCDGPADAVDHVVPVSAGGPTEADNLVAACQSCNSRKGDTRPEDLLATLYEHGIYSRGDLEAALQRASEPRG